MTAKTAKHEKPLSQAIRERRATPSFDGTPIPPEDLHRILEAGLSAPSGYNMQPWRFVVVQGEEQKKRLRAARAASTIEQRLAHLGWREAYPRLSS